MSQSAVLGPGPATLSGVMRIALFEEERAARRASLVALPGDRVETNALLMPASPSWASPSTTVTSVGDALVTPPAAEPLVTLAAAWAALLAVLVITAGAAAMASVVALGFPT